MTRGGASAVGAMVSGAFVIGGSLWLLPTAAAVPVVGSALEVATSSSLAAPGEPVHLGVSTCAGAPCHGSISKSADGPVRLDEYTVWNRRDAHSKAYDLLFDDPSKRIAKNLGLAQPAHEAKLCLDCHADNPPAPERGPRFSVETGVGCEACHGGSAAWIDSHAEGRGHAENLAAGMFPTDDPEQRAELCLSCHFGNAEKFVDHRLMGAGHPRQKFELYIFTQTQPAHFDVDDDYRARGKQALGGPREWAIGQAVAVRHSLDALLDPKRNHHGIWPEFVLFDCHACHHPMSAERWQPSPSFSLEPGLARLNDSSFLMLRQVMAQLDPAAAGVFMKDLRALHRATSRGDGGTEQVAARLRQQVVAFLPRLRSWQVDAAVARKLVAGIAAEGAAGEYTDYSRAEQATLALQILTRTDKALYQRTKDSVNTLNGFITGGANAVRYDENFDARKFRQALRALGNRL